MKKIVSMIIALCVILSVCLIPTVITTTAEESTPLDDTIDNVIKAEVKFTNGDEGVNKEVRTALYSISFSYAPARLEFLGLDYNFGSSTTQGNAPIRSREWSIAYDYLLEDEVVGLGGMFTSQPYDWYVATNAGEDLTTGVGTWQNAKISLDSLMATDVYSKPLYALAFVVKTTAAVDTSKTYNVYYKNIRVVDKSGNTIYTFFDNSVTTQELNPQVWDVQKNASMTISVVDDPNPTPVGGGEGEGGAGEGAGGTTPPPADDNTVKDTIKATVKFTDGTEGTEKYAFATLYGWNAPIFNSYKFSYGDKLVWEYALTDDAIAGLGTMDYQSSNNSWMTDYTKANPKGESFDVYGNSYTAATDLTKVPGYKSKTWITESVTPHEGISALPHNSWQSGIQHIVITAKTTAAVDTNKEYVAYYRNIRIVDASGKTKLVLFDGTQDIAADTTNIQDKATIKLEKVANPYKDVIEAPKTERVIKLSVKYTYFKEMQGKTGWLSIFGFATTTATPLKEGDKISYDVMLESPMAGLGALSYQENETGGGFWQGLHQFAVDKGMVDSNGLSITPDTDLSDVATGKWYTRVMDIANPNREACHWLVGINSTKAAAVEGKEYNVYYKNLKIIHADGTETILFDGTQDINPQSYEEVKGAELRLSLADLIISGPGKSPGTGDSNRDTAIVLTFVMILSLAVLSTTVIRRKTN